MKSQFTKEDAVSPVVGVMLMLVVTIVIAAAVAMFSTGLVDNTTPTPTAIIDYSGSNSKDGTLVFLHKGGDDFDLRDVTLILSRGEGSSPVEYTYNGSPYSVKSIDGDSRISAGEYFAIGPINLAGSGSTVEYSLLQNGNTITSGKLVVPAGIVAEPEGIVTLGIAGGTIIPDHGLTYEFYKVGTYITAGSSSISVGTSLLFYINGFDTDEQQVSGVGAAATLVVEKEGGSSSIVKYTGAPYYGFLVTFNESGTYTISGKVPSGIASTMTYTDTSEYTSEYAAYSDGGDITVIVS